MYIYPLVEICASCREPMPCRCARSGFRTKKLQRWRSKEFLEFVRLLPCSVPGCREREIEAAHFGPRGMSTKVHDCLAIPLCAFHHRESHLFGHRWEWAGYVTKWQLQTMTAAMIAKIGR